MTGGGAGRRIRVALLIGSLDVGGAERQLVRLANSLDRTRFEPLVLTWFGRGSLAADLSPDVELRALAFTNLSGSRALLRPLVAARVMRALVRELRRFRPDILHAYLVTGYALGALAAKIAGVPATVAGRRGLNTYDQLPFPGPWFGRLANRLIALHICNSVAARDFALAHERDLDPRRLVVVPNGLDVAVLSAAALPDGWRPARGALGAMVANFHRYKGHRLVIESLARIPPGVAVRIVFVGSGTEEPGIRRWVAERGLEDRVLFAGARSDADRLISAFDFSLLASSTESFPNSLLEAMAWGVPVVAPRVGGVPELVRDGVDGLLFEPGDAAGLAACISRLATDPGLREQLGNHARERVAGGFSVAAMVTRVQDAYVDVLRQMGRAV